MEVWMQMFLQQQFSPANETAKRTCLKLYLDGRYRLEKLDDWPVGGSAVDIFESVLSDSEMKELSDIIGQKDFEVLQNEPTKSGFFVMKPEGQVVFVEVRRLGQVQKFAVADSNGRTSLPSAVVPLLKWIGKLKPDKSSRIKNAKPIFCGSAGIPKPANL
jgi:hypothetical protein